MNAAARSPRNHARRRAARRRREVSKRQTLVADSRPTAPSAGANRPQDKRFAAFMAEDVSAWLIFFAVRGRP